MTIQESLFLIILLIVYIVVFVLFACINALLSSIETKKIRLIVGGKGIFIRYISM